MSVQTAAAAPVAAQAQTRQAVQTAVAAAAEDVIDLISSSGEDLSPQHAASGQGAGPSRHHAAMPGRRGQQQRRQAAAEADASNVIDLTGAVDPELHVVRSTVQRVPMRGLKRPRPRPAAAPTAAQLSPMKQLLLQQLRNPLPPPPAEPEPEGPKCGICMEPMAGTHGRQMASGSCGHVYCHDCLVAAVRTQKKCPTCRKNMQQRQIHKVFVSFT